jgi:hypothetical protein
MINHYINILIRAFDSVWFLRISALILFLFTMLALILVVIIILLDKAYRPSIPQYPFNFFLDRLIPLIALFLPLLLVLFLCPTSIPWIQRFFVLILIHCFILIPLFYYWSDLRSWSNSLDNTSFIPKQYRTWDNPCLYLDISIALIYPMIWGMYLSCSRYFRLGSTVDLYSILLGVNSNWFIVLFLFPYWLPFFLIIASSIKRNLWEHTYKILYSLHLFAIRFSCYFFVIETLFKFNFLVVSLISLQGPVYFKEDVKSRLHLIINYFFYHPKVFDIFFILSLIIELYFNKGYLYYGTYTLFIYPIMRTILSIFFNLYYEHDWFFDCCLSDYIRSNFISPRYPLIFWQHAADAHDSYGFSWDLPSKLLVIQQSYIIKYSSILKRSSKLHIRIFKSKDRYPFRIRFTSSFYNEHQIRWVHTQIVNKLHSATPFFIHNIYDRINLINDSWRNLSRIQHLDKNRSVVTPSNLYHNFPRSYPLQKNKIIGIQEENLPTNFIPLIENNVVVEPYNKHLHSAEYLSQPEPDLYLGFSQSLFKEKRNLTVDLKSDGGLGRNHILTEITDFKYKSTLNRHRKHLDPSNATELNLVLDNLALTCNDFDNHQLVWAKSLHLFPPYMLPPLRLPQNINTKLFTQETLIQLKKSSIKLKLISDHLHNKKVPNVSGNQYPIEAYDLFEDCYIQKLLREE